MNYKGKVKNVSTTTYNALLNFGDIEKGSKLYGNTKYEFDQKGNKLKQYSFETDGQLNEKRTYSFNEFDDRIEKKIFDKNEELYLHKEYKYKGDECQKFIKFRNEKFRLQNKFKNDNLGNRIEKIEYASLGKIIGVYKYKYDRRNNCLEEIRYKYDGKIDFIVKNKYDKNGNQIQTKELNSEGLLGSKSKCKYDKDSNCLKMGFYKSDNTLVRIYTYKHDFHGNVVKSKELNPEGKLIFSKKKFDYRYDQYGNWIYLTSFRKTKNQVWTPYEITERFFEYYE